MRSSSSLPLLCLACLLAGACGSAPPEPDEPTLLDLTWMVGRWGDVEEGWFVRECWEPSGEAMVGRSRAAAPGGLAWDQEMRIEPGGSGLVMRTRPSSEQAASSRPDGLVLVSATSREATFEGPRGRVVYRHDELRDALLVEDAQARYVVERIGSGCGE